ncbi:MAG: hypothetical protein HQM04_15150 [Magnetococcales bacterium]|nr:hypothetical protein [Magnetococcales bacterium]MBF0116363.1 hypothetical protein [Magnetococcales bacterium]
MKKKHKKNRGDRENAAREILLAVDNQLHSPDMPEVKATYERMLSLGYDDEDARKLIGSALACEIFLILAENQEFDRDRYRATLDMLPELPE